MEELYTPRYTFNEHYFDVIDSPEKAYWIGFIWCDGYLHKRFRGNRLEYDFKLSLAEVDEGHLFKFKESLNSTHEIKTYGTYNNSFKTESIEKRLFICNKYFGKVLYDNYGLIANRCNTSKLINNIPEKYYRDFIRGTLDSDGSISCGWVNDSYKGGKDYKMHLSWSTYEELLLFIQEYLYENNLIQSKNRISQRHEGRDMYCRILSYCGNNQVPRILSHIYNDATVYLDRKYDKYKEIIDFKRGVVAV